jgi:hypothetical protein
MEDLVKMLFFPGWDIDWNLVEAATIHTACEMLLYRFKQTEIPYKLKDGLISKIRQADQCLIYRAINFAPYRARDLEVHLALRSLCRLLHLVGAPRQLAFELALVRDIERMLDHEVHDCHVHLLALPLATIESIRPFVTFPRVREEIYRMSLEDPYRNHSIEHEWYPYAD